MTARMFGKYVLEREIAKGGMAHVFLATLRGAGGFEKKLVVKLIRDELAYDPEFVKRFVDEAKTTVSLTHPNIVTVYELGMEAGAYFIAMEHVNGISVRELLAGVRTLSPAEGAYVGAEICRALGYAHRKMGVVHRDITPGNVMIDEEGAVKLIDFGIAAHASLSGHTVLGTPGHMPPEQYRGASVGPEGDLFSLAAFLLEVWSGNAPFRRSTAEESEKATLDSPPLPSAAAALLHSLDPLIQRALSHDPKDRPSSAEEFGKSLRSFLSGSDTTDIARSLGKRVATLRAEAPPQQEDASSPIVATRPHETRTFAERSPVAPPSPLSTRKLPAEDSSPRTRFPVWLAVPIAGVIGVGLWRALSVSPAPSNLPAAPVQSAPTEIETAPALPVRLPPTVPSPTERSPGASTSLLPPQRAPGAVPDARAHITLMGDPGTRASIDGIEKGACPVKMVLSPGMHEIRFTFDATGESRGERVSLRAGENVAVFADFASATPTVHVERH